VVKVVMFFLILILTIGAYAQEFKYPYNPLTERDPLRPLIDEEGNILIKEKKEGSSFVLQGIIYSPQGSVAIINNELLHEGDALMGQFKVKKIESNGVVLEKEGKEYFLKWEG